MKKKISIIIIGCVLFLAALGVTFYPLISNYVNNKYQSEIQTQYETCVEEMGESRLRDLWEAARNYNDSLNTVQYNKPCRILRYQGTWKTAQENRHADSAGPGLEPCHSQPRSA